MPGCGARVYLFSSGSMASSRLGEGRPGCSSDVGEAWEIQERLHVYTLQAPSPGREGRGGAGSLSTMESTPNAARSVGLQKWEAFQGGPAPLGGARLGPGRQLASCNPAITRQRRLGSGGGVGVRAESFSWCCLCL